MLLRLLVLVASIVSIIRLLILRVINIGAPVEVSLYLLGWLRLDLLLDLVNLVILLPQLQLSNRVELDLDLLTAQLSAIKVVNRGLGALRRFLRIVDVRLNRRIVEGGCDELDLCNGTVLLKELLQLSVHLTRVF